MTAKQLEGDTGCKIMVRGRGSMRDKQKVKTLNLEEKVGQLKKQLDQQQNEVLTIHKVWQERNQPLNKQLAWQQQIIAALIDPEDLKNYEKAQLLEVIK